MDTGFTVAVKTLKDYRDGAAFFKTRHFYILIFTFIIYQRVNEMSFISVTNSVSLSGLKLLNYSKILLIVAEIAGLNRFALFYFQKVYRYS